MRIVAKLSLAVALGASLLACRSAPSKAGAEVAPVSLSVLSYTTNALTGDTARKLIEEVKQSGTEVELREASPLDAGAADGSSDTITAVREGRADIAVVAARSFDLAGVTSLQALSAPLAVESPEQAALFLGDPVTEEMLAGLTTTGVVGLALTYDSLTQPLGFASALREPADLKNARVLVRPSRATEAFIKALGATPDARNGENAATAISTGEVAAALTSMDRPSGFQAGPEGKTSGITANVQLTIKANVIIVNAKVWAGLTSHQKATLSTAAANTRTWAGSQIVRLDAAAKAFCADHIGNVIVADGAQLKKWLDSAKTTVADLSRDPVTSKSLARLTTIVHEHPSQDIPSACETSPLATTAAAPTTSAAADSSAIEGQWRLAVSAQKMRETGASAQSAVANQGTWTLVFHADGTYVYVEPHKRTCPGRFTINDNRLSMSEDAGVRDCSGQWDFTFERTGDNLSLLPTPHFAKTLGGDVGFFSNPLIRIGNAPPS